MAQQSVNQADYECPFLGIVLGEFRNVGRRRDFDMIQHQHIHIEVGGLRHIILREGYDKWGERSIIHQAVKKVFHTLKDFGILAPIDKQGNFALTQQKLNNPNIVYLLAAAILQASGKEYMTWESIVNHPALFPFQIEHVTQADIAAYDHLALERMGDAVVIREK